MTEVHPDFVPACGVVHVVRFNLNNPAVPSQPEVMRGLHMVKAHHLIAPLVHLVHLFIALRRSVRVLSTGFERDAGTKNNHCYNDVSPEPHFSLLRINYRYSFHSVQPTNTLQVIEYFAKLRDSDLLLWLAPHVLKTITNQLIMVFARATWLAQLKSIE
jgi:hypothetical protein